MGKTQKQREGGSFIIGINNIAVIFLLSAVLSGLVTDMEAASFEYHILLGLASSVLGLFGMTFLMFYFIMTGAYIKEGVRSHNLEGTLRKRLSGIKARLFPLTALVIVLLIGTPVAGAALQTGKEGRYIHLFTAILVAAVYIMAMRRAKKELLENRALALEVLEKSETA